MGKEIAEAQRQQTGVSAPERVNPRRLYVGLVNAGMSDGRRGADVEELRSFSEVEAWMGSGAFLESEAWMDEREMDEQRMD